MTAFLEHLKDIATSPLAYVGYLAALAAWVGRLWMVNSPQQQASKIVAAFKDDRQRAEALGTLLGEKPPTGLARKEILDWVRIKSKEKARFHLIFAYVCTLVTAVAVIGLAVHPHPAQTPHQ